MSRRISIFAAVCALTATTPGKANFVVEPTFEEKMAESQLVILGTVTAVERGTPDGFGSTATLSVWMTLKGESQNPLTVSTYNAVEELNPHCCEVGASYMMFLRRSLRDGRLMSDWGQYGMIRIGGPISEIQTVPDD